MVFGPPNDRYHTEKEPYNLKKTLAACDDIRFFLKELLGKVIIVISP